MSGNNRRQGDRRDSVMFFLLRVAFWLSIVVILLPTGQSHPPALGPHLSAVDAMSAAGAAVSDLRHFCGRQPDACAVGGQAAVAFGHKAQASARMLYEFLTEKLAPNDNAATNASATGSIATRKASASVPLPVAAPRRSGSSRSEQSRSRQSRLQHWRSQNTLTPADLVAPWRGPMRRSEDQIDHPA